MEGEGRGGEALVSIGQALKSESIQPIQTGRRTRPYRLIWSRMVLADLEACDGKEGEGADQPMVIQSPEGTSQ